MSVTSKTMLVKLLVAALPVRMADALILLPFPSFPSALPTSCLSLRQEGRYNFLTIRLGRVNQKQDYPALPRIRSKMML